MSALSLAPVPVARLRLTQRGRRVITGLVALPVVAALSAALLLGGSSAVATGQAGSVDFSHVTVSAGETLWGIAERIAPTADPRDVIAEVMRLNGLMSSAVQPGQRLAIPTAYAH